MRLDPTAAEPHRFAGRCLAAAGQDALARREYRLAALFGDGEALPEAMRRWSSLDDLLQVAPGTPQALLSLAALLAPERPADAAAVLGRAWTEFGELPALRWHASLALQLGDAEGALALAAAFRERQPLDPAGWTVAAAALDRLGRPDEAQRMLEDALARIPGSPAVLVPLAQRALARRLYSEARRLVESMSARTPPELAGKRLQVASILWAQGRYGEALEQARSAAGAVPDDPGPRTVVSSYAAAMGRYDEAIAALEGAAALPRAAAGAYEKRLAELREARQRQLDERNRKLLEGGALPR
jgi:tetratricopeptide (TPR) repeat protein